MSNVWFGLEIAIVKPSPIAMLRNAALMYPLSGRPKDILDKPHVVAYPFILQYLIVSRVSTPPFLLAPTVLTRPSTIISSLVKPMLRALPVILLIISIFSSRDLGSPSSDRGSNINAAPYFLAIGRSFVNFSVSYEIEFISALPGYLLRAASIISTWLESILSGSVVMPSSSSSTRSIMDFSSTPLMPTLTSNTLAPFSSCCSANRAILSVLPSLSSACRVFLPVGLILSPTIKNASSSVNLCVRLSLVR